MGYQESFIKFRNKEVLIKELKKYQKRDTTNDLATLVCVDRVKKDIMPFEKGELVAVVCGERSEQRSKMILLNRLGIGNVQDIVFIDSYWEISNGKGVSLSDFLDEHFEKLTERQFQELIS